MRSGEQSYQNYTGKAGAKPSVKYKYKLTMKKQAPSNAAFILTSKSIGNVTQKLSASVKNSRAVPDHCFVILPTLVSPIAE